MAIYPAFYTRGAFIGGPTSNGTSGQTLITAGDGTSSWSNTLTAATTATSALIAKALAGQSAVTFKVVSSDDSVHFSAGGTSVISNVNVDFASKLTVTPASVGQVVTTITGLSSQTATLLQLNHGSSPGANANYLSCTSSGGTEGGVLALTSAGFLGLGIAAPIRAFHVSSSSTCGRLQRSNSSGTTSFLEIYNPDTTDANGAVVSFSTDTTGGGATTAAGLGQFGCSFVTHNHGTRAADFFISLANSGAVTEKLRLTAAGLVGINKTSSIGAMLHVVPNAVGTIGQIVQAAVSQTANLQEWQNSSGTVVASIGPGTLAADGTQFGLKVKPILNATPTGTCIAASVEMATASGSNQYAVQGKLTAGATDAKFYLSFIAENTVAGQGVNSSSMSFANYGVYSGANATTIGHNVGVGGNATGGNVNIGTLGVCQTNKDSAANIGVLGYARNSAVTAPVHIGGFFGLRTTHPTFVSAALIADNGSQTDPIFLARDNASTVFTIADGGVVTATGQVRTASLGVGNSAAATTPGTVTKKMEVFDAAGASLGFVPIYDAIT